MVTATGVVTITDPSSLSERTIGVDAGGVAEFPGHLRVDLVGRDHHERRRNAVEVDLGAAQFGGQRIAGRDPPTPSGTRGWCRVTETMLPGAIEAASPPPASVVPLAVATICAVV